MKTGMGIVIMLLAGLSGMAFAQENAMPITEQITGQNEMTLSAMGLAAFLTAVIHTIMGPDHYLPFVAIGKSRDYSLQKTLFWTFICGVGHIVSALLIAIAFIYLSQWLDEENFVWIEANRGNVAAYALIGLGAAYLLWAMRHRWLHKHQATHSHLIQFTAMQNTQTQNTSSRNISVWVLFIIFVLGPCEALLPILTASSVLGVTAVLLSTLIFSVATIATMMSAVALGMLGIHALRFHKLEAYAHEIAGVTIMMCGLAIILGL